jgi:hypothetical protein
MFSFSSPKLISVVLQDFILFVFISKPMLKDSLFISRRRPDDYILLFKHKNVEKIVN